MKGQSVLGIQDESTVYMVFCKSGCKWPGPEYKSPSFARCVKRLMCGYAVSAAYNRTVNCMKTLAGRELTY